MILTEEFLESMVHCVQDPPKIFKRWYQVDTEQLFPEDKNELLEWIMGHRGMQHCHLTRDNVLKCFDIWLKLQPDLGVAHPESFQKGVDGLIVFFETYCHSPSLLQVYNEPYGHDDDVEYVIFFVGRLRHASQTLLVNTILLKLNRYVD